MLEKNVVVNLDGSSIKGQFVWLLARINFGTMPLIEFVSLVQFNVRFVFLTLFVLPV